MKQDYYGDISTLFIDMPVNQTLLEITNTDKFHISKIQEYVDRMVQALDEFKSILISNGWNDIRLIDAYQIAICKSMFLGLKTFSIKIYQDIFDEFTIMIGDTLFKILKVEKSPHKIYKLTMQLNYDKFYLKQRSIIIELISNAMFYGEALAAGMLVYVTSIDKKLLQNDSVGFSFLNQHYCYESALDYYHKYKNQIKITE